MITKKSIVDQIEIRRDGSTGVRVALLVVDGEQEIDSKWHRTVVAEGASVQAQMQVVNDHLSQMGYPPVSVQDIERITRHATATD